MNVKRELNAIKGRMFTNQLIKTLLDAHFQEVKADGLLASEQDCSESQAALAAILNQEQKSILSSMEESNHENLKYTAQLTFERGIFAGFQHHLSSDPLEEPFKHLVIDELLTMPNMQKYPDYIRRRDQAQQLYEQLSEQLGQAGREHLAFILAAWDDQLYGVLRHAFYMGYRYALSMIDEIFPFQKKIGQILLTEHELGFLSTCEEQERTQSRA